MPRRRGRRKSIKSASKSNNRKKVASNLFLNTSLVVLSLFILALSYSWLHRQFIAEPNDSAAFIQLSEKPTTLTSKMWLEKQFRDIKVEVLNGNGVDGIAATATDFLREQGFDVVRTDDADRTDYVYTLIKDRAGNLHTARRLAEILNVDTLSVFQEINRSLMLDATVILGKDYANLAPFATLKDIP